ncbi:MAG: hypothetical protein KFB96_03115 [Thiocapsa sp.]|uniref:hypothetical protein n=1 Tax=Thiocapsa sp. TaxID=2024551 RepID=UPI001BCDF626|nr:hypothetical protein [Thiocapsa sp.]QVL49518.1 MAG: hypothetical protein KFB96_03115 [Thiocapsa sp.]
MFSQELTDIDSLALGVRDRESRRLIMEAIAAYRGGALRSAIMSTWIAIVYDIISKARELATQGEADPQAFVTELDKAIAADDLRKLQRIESNILETSNDRLQLLAPHEYDALKRLQDDRNLCAHPAFVFDDELYQPSLELARSHIVHALQHLLVHAPLQGKSAVARFDADLLSASFPVLPDAIGRYLRVKYLDRAKDVLVINLMKGVLTAPFGAERAKYLGKERLLALALGEIYHAKTAIYDKFAPSFISQRFDGVGDDVLLRLCTYLEVDRRIWSWLSEPVRIRLRTLVESDSVETLKAFSVFDAFNIPDLAHVLTERFDAFDETTQIGIITESPKREFADRAIEIYATAKNYRRAEDLGQALIVRLSEHFNEEHVRSLLATVSGNDQIFNAGGTPAILVTVFDQTRALLGATLDDWRSFVEVMTVRAGGDQDSYYAYPDLRAKLDAV